MDKKIRTLEDKIYNYGMKIMKIENYENRKLMEKKLANLKIKIRVLQKQHLCKKLK